MNILLTGGMGYIGSHTAVALQAAGHSPVLYDNLCNSKADVLERIGRISGSQPAFVQGDIRDTALLTQTLREHCIDAVIHFAGLKAVGESVAQPIDYYANNVQGTISLLQAMQAVGVKTIVFSSSATVYGEPQYLPYDEEHPTSATNPYGRSKLHIEEILADLSRAEPDWRIACLRYFNPVGAHDSGLIGEAPTGIPNNLMPYVAQVASGKLPHLNVFGNDYPTTDGTGVRDYIHVMDLATGHLAALNFLTKGKPVSGPPLQGGDAAVGVHTFNLGTGHGSSVLEIVKAFEAATDKAVKYRIVKRRPGDIASCYAQADKAMQRLGWRASRSLQDMCISTWRFMLCSTMNSKL